MPDGTSRIPVLQVDNNIGLFCIWEVIAMHAYAFGGGKLNFDVVFIQLSFIIAW